jgi:hypothetical protein
MTTRYEVAIRRPDDGRLLVLADRTIPSFTMEAAPAWQEVTIVAESLLERYGLEVVTLRAVRVEGSDGASPRERRLYETEYVGGPLPGGWSWVDDGDAAGGIVTRLGRPSGDRQPWYRGGWLAEMSAWIDARLAEAGIRRRGPLRQVRWWGRAALLTLETDHGRLWVKAVPDAFSHEVAVTELLADIDPGFVPPVVAADRTLGRIITEHVEGPTLAAIGDDPAIWTAAMSRLAEVQRVLAADPAALRVAGVAAAPLGQLAASLPAILADDELLLVGRPGGLSVGDAAKLRGRLPALVDACHALEASGVPDSLEHGDLATDEVILGPMGPVVLDWSDGSITHPFLSAASLLRSGAAAGDIADDRVAAYLGPWLAAGHLTAADGRQAMALARVVLPLHLAALYAERILPGLEQRWEMERVVPDALRAILPG